MARIEGVDLPKDKPAQVALTYIFGIGESRAEQVIEDSGVDGDIRTKDLTDEQVNKIREAILDKDWNLEGDLRKERTMAIKRLIEINCYRGRRHRKGLPVRGQRTRTNARTRKGPKKEAVASKKAPQKT